MTTCSITNEQIAIENNRLFVGGKMVAKREYGNWVMQPSLISSELRAIVVAAIADAPSSNDHDTLTTLDWFFSHAEGL